MASPETRKHLNFVYVTTTSTIRGFFRYGFRDADAKKHQYKLVRQHTGRALDTCPMQAGLASKRAFPMVYVHCNMIVSTS